MRATGWATAAGFCVLAIPGAWAQTVTADPSPPAPPAARAKLPPQLRPGLDELSPTSVWSRQEVEVAQARCTALLGGLDVVAVPETPIREGRECGTPAPMKLISIGKSPQVALSPPPTITCDLIAALHIWLHRDVQPLARRHLGAPVIRIEAMSSYSCRNAYGRASGRLSEHGRANALDIRAFTTARAETVFVAADWGPTAREIASAVAKGDAEQAETGEPADALQNEPISDLASRPAPNLVTPTAPRWQRADVAFGMAGLGVAWSVATDPEKRLAATPPSRLGGPNTSAATASVRTVADRTEFLREAHRAACKIFGTVLGPEANNAHKNHFHVDMAERKVTVICE
jgi:hypothetical protein